MNQELNLHKCKNCSNEFIGTFCNICGQQFLEQVKIKYLFKNIIDLFELEKGYLLTLKAIYTNKNFIDSYIDGKTIKYTNPIRFFFISLIIVSCLDILSKTIHNWEINNLVSWIPYEYVLYLPLIFVFYILLYIFFRKNNSNIKIVISTLYVYSIFPLFEVIQRFLFHFDNYLIFYTFLFFSLANITYILNNIFLKSNRRIVNLSFIILFVSLFFVISMIISGFIFDYIDDIK